MIGVHSGVRRDNAQVFATTHLTTRLRKLGVYLTEPMISSAGTSGYLDRNSLSGVEVFALDMRLSALPGVPVRHQQVPAAVQLRDLS